MIPASGLSREPSVPAVLYQRADVASMQMLTDLFIPNDRPSLLREIAANALDACENSMGVGLSCTGEIFTGRFRYIRYTRAETPRIVFDLGALPFNRGTISPNLAGRLRRLAVQESYLTNEQSEFIKSVIKEVFHKKTIPEKITPVIPSMQILFSSPEKIPSAALPPAPPLPAPPLPAKKQEDLFQFDQEKPVKNPNAEPSDKPKELKEPREPVSPKALSLPPKANVPPLEMPKVNNKDDDDEQNPFLCAIGLAEMRDPVISPGGHTYDRKNIEEWLSKNKTSPFTNQPLRKEDLRPNRALKEAIEYTQKLRNNMKPTV